MPNPFPTVTIHNELDVPVVLYDAFQSDPHAPSNAETLLGTLTRLATVKASSSEAITPIHGPISAYLAYDSNGGPIAREFTMGTGPVTRTIDQKDTDRIAATGRFVDLINADPRVAKSFQALLNGERAALAVTAFFQHDAPAEYKDCTFVSYLMVVAARARKPGAEPVESATYSLSQLCNSLGGRWPSVFPDITVRNFTCHNENDSFVLSGDVAVRDLPFVPEATSFIRSILPDSVRATLQFHYGLDLGVLGTRIMFSLPSISLVDGVRLDNPTITLDISPLFEFAVFTAKATIPFSLFGKTFKANVSMVIDNAEAEIGVVLDGDHGSLLAPPVMKGVHFDEFGVGMGFFFEPPSYVLGVEGKFHIGDGSGSSIVQLDDDAFALVCRMDGDVPDPQYIAFNVPKLELGDLITIFTNTSVDLGVPITASDLSFHWSENPLEPVALPDGSLSDGGYGFSGNLDFFGLSFYADMQMDLNGVRGRAAMAPLSLGPLTMTGDGLGVSIKVDANGNPIRNNQIATTKQMRDAIAKATTTQLVAPGGPYLAIDTGGSPYLTLSAGVKLFDVFSESIKASVASDGIRFELDCGAVLSGTMKCTLHDFHNLQCDFTFGIDKSISLPSVGGFGMGSIPLRAQCNATLEVDASGGDVVVSVKAGFDFEGVSMSIGPFKLDSDTAGISGLVSRITEEAVDYAAGHAGDLLGLNNLGQWAQWVGNGMIQGVESVVKVLSGLGMPIDNVANLLGSCGFPADRALKELMNEFSPAASQLASYLQNSFRLPAAPAAALLRDARFLAGDIGSALSSVYGCGPDAVHDILQGAGFSAGEIGPVLTTIWPGIDPTHWDLPSPPDWNPF
jgi:hypothetical protein